MTKRFLFNVMDSMLASGACTGIAFLSLYMLPNRPAIKSTNQRRALLDPENRLYHPVQNRSVAGR